MVLEARQITRVWTGHRTERYSESPVVERKLHLCGIQDRVRHVRCKYTSLKSCDIKTKFFNFQLLDEKRRKIDLFPTSSSRTIDPCIAQIDEKYFGVIKDEYLITIGSSGETEKDLKNLKSKGEMVGVGSSSGNLASMVNATSVLDFKNKAYPTLAWKEPLQMLVYDEPYLIGLVTDAVEIRVFDAAGMEKTNLIQTIPELSKARFLIQGSRGLLYAASINHLWCIQAIDIAQQRTDLLQDKKFNLALQLTVININDTFLVFTDGLIIKL